MKIDLNCQPVNSQSGKSAKQKIDLKSAKESWKIRENICEAGSWNLRLWNNRFCWELTVVDQTGPGWIVIRCLKHRSNTHYIPIHIYTYSEPVILAVTTKIRWKYVAHVCLWILKKLSDKKVVLKALYSEPLAQDVKRAKGKIRPLTGTEKKGEK